jgi:dTDP-4-dehydrorhamnose 3,5-epimerase
MALIWIETSIPGCWVFERAAHQDSRGTFIKMFERKSFQEKGLDFNFDEVYFSSSHKNVIRGLHFQTPPFDHAKVISCLQGEILDVVVDLRKSSPVFSKVLSFELSPEKGRSVVIPRGCAHGFYSAKDDSMIAYLVETGHAPTNDLGILWSSINFKWPTTTPILSPRDAGFPALKDFKSPF